MRVRLCILITVAASFVVCAQSAYPINRELRLRERYETLMYFHSTCAITGEGVDEGARLEVDLKIPIAFGGDTDFFNRWALCVEAHKEKNDFFTNLSTNDWIYVFGGTYATTRFYRYAKVSKGLSTPTWALEIIAREAWRDWDRQIPRLRAEGIIVYTIDQKNDRYSLRIVSNASQYEGETNQYIRNAVRLTPPIRANGRAEHAPRRAFSRSFRKAIREKYNDTCQRCGRRSGDALNETQTTAIEIDHIVPVSWGGGNDEENVWTLCKFCNIGKSDYYADGPNPIVETILNMKSAQERLLRFCALYENAEVDPYLLRIVSTYAHQDWSRTLRRLREERRLDYLPGALYHIRSVSVERFDNGVSDTIDDLNGNAVAK